MNDRRSTDVLLTNDAIYWRGLFVHRYAGIEFSLTHLLAIASTNPHYSALGPLPYRLNSKIKRLEELLDVEGPLRSHAAELQRYVDYFRGLEQMRTHIAHAIMTAQEGDQGAVCKFRMWQHKNREPVAVFWDLPLSQLKEATEAIQPYSTGFTGLVSRLVRELVPRDD